MVRDRIIGLWMIGVEKHERKLLNAFAGHNFSWRWEELEGILFQLIELWPVLRKYVNYEQLSRGGELSGLKLEHLANSLKNDPEATIPL